MDEMRSLASLVAEALRGAEDDGQLARMLIANGALAQLIEAGLYDAERVQKRLGYSGDSLRAQLSKARRGLGEFPLPRVEGRLWAAEDVEAYRRDHARKGGKRARVDNAGTRGGTGNAVTGGDAGNAFDGDSGDIGTVGDSRGITHVTQPEGRWPDQGAAR